METLSRNRQTLRWRGYDYAESGAYFLTICVEQRLPLLAHFADEQLRFTESGAMIEACWLDLPSRFSSVALDEYVVMPNHFHGILFLDNAIENDEKRATTRIAPTIGDVVGAWKSLTTNAYIKGVQDFGWPRFSGRLWQRNYYERVIRSERELNAIREYIALNPARWAQDRENPERA